MQALVKKLLILGCFLAAGSNTASAESATFRNGELLISHGMVIENNRDRYYRNIKLISMPDGLLRLARAQPRKLILLEELELSQIYTEPVQVEILVSGYKSMPCTELEPVAIKQVEHTFHVLIAQTLPDPLTPCAQVLTPVDLTIELDTSELLPGEYLVLVNNEAMEFTMENFNE